MAITAGTEAILDAAHVWRDRCLLDGGSVFTNVRLWTSEHLDELNKHFVENLDEGEGTFIEKLHEQIAPASAGAKKLAAEMTWVMMLFPNSLSTAHKRNLVTTIWEWSGERFPREHPLLGLPLDRGIGSAGMGYNNYRWAELILFIVLMRDWRARSRQEQEELLADPWGFAAWLDTIPGAQNRQFRHMLLHLLFPEQFERISSSSHKARVDKAFTHLLDGDTPKGTFYLSRDQRLGQIRQALMEQYPGEIVDFYASPIAEQWQGNDEEDVPGKSPEVVEKQRVTPVVREKKPEPDNHESAYHEPGFQEIVAAVQKKGLRIPEQTLRRYHLALKSRGFVVLSGVSGTGKTWLTEVYAEAVGAEHLIVPVAPNWTTNEDLLGYLNPLDGEYHDTAFSRYLRDAAEEYRRGQQTGRTARPYHLVLDEMNLARVEYYFARFLSAMEVRARHGSASIELAPNLQVMLTPNLYFIGTVNVDETTHGFADKIYDRAQLIEMEAPRAALAEHLAEVAYGDTLLEIWTAVSEVAPFAFRVVDDIVRYVKHGAAMGAGTDELLDEQILQKVLPKLSGADPRLGDALTQLKELTMERFPLSRAKAERMCHGFEQHGFASYF